MKKLRDFFYDKNDIILALIILAVAGLLIVWRIDVIMAYPETLAKETKTEQTTKHDAVDKAKQDEAKKAEADKEKADKEKADKDAKEETKETASVWDGSGRLSTDLSVTVSSDSPADALNSLINAGLFSSTNEISKDFSNNGTSMESLKSGTFKFSKGASKADVISILTK